MDDLNYNEVNAVSPGVERLEKTEFDPGCSKLEVPLGYPSEYQQVTPVFWSDA